MGIYLYISNSPPLSLLLFLLLHSCSYFYQIINHIYALIYLLVSKLHIVQPHIPLSPWSLFREGAVLPRLGPICSGWSPSPQNSLWRMRWTASPFWVWSLNGALSPVWCFPLLSMCLVWKVTGVYQDARMDREWTTSQWLWEAEEQLCVEGKGTDESDTNWRESLGVLGLYQRFSFLHSHLCLAMSIPLLPSGDHPHSKPADLGLPRWAWTCWSGAVTQGLKPDPSW